MRVGLSLFGPIGGGLLLLVLLVSAEAGIMYGAAAENASAAQVDISVADLNLTNTSDYDQPLVPDQYEGDGEPSPAGKAVINATVKPLVGVMLGVMQQSARVGYQNRGWISPTWAGYAFQAVNIGTAIAVLGVYGRRFWRVWNRGAFS